ncbi:MAG: hypothetical protein GY861_02825 [bacterium]|nr:hypothetical protein [bacterium]
MELEERKVPEIVSIVALGNSKAAFFGEVLTTGNPRGLADEVWAINKLGCIVNHDVLWRMDDLKHVWQCNSKMIQTKKEDEPVSVHDTYTEWLKNHDKPIITSTAYPDEFPTSVEYPLEGVINTIGYTYYRTTPAYAAAFAIHIGVKQLRLYGCDYIYPHSSYVHEAGRANLEFVLGVGMAMGIEVFVPHTSTLLDACIPSYADSKNKIYGYVDPMEVLPDPDDDKKWKVYKRPERGQEIRDAEQLAEEKKLQSLLYKYGPMVKDNFITGGVITKEDIDEYEKQGLLDASQDGTVQEEPQIGEEQNADPT